jgi:hypothetical protein
MNTNNAFETFLRTVFLVPGPVSSMVLAIVANNNIVMDLISVPPGLGNNINPANSGIKWRQPEGMHCSYQREMIKTTRGFLAQAEFVRRWQGIRLQTKRRVPLMLTGIAVTLRYHLPGFSGDKVVKLRVL